MSLKSSFITLITSIFLQIPSILALVSHHSNPLHKFNLPYPHSFSGDKLYKNLIGDEGRVYACSGKNFFAFESNGSIAWALYLNYTCNPNIAPLHGGTTKIYLVAEKRVLKIYPLRIETNEDPVRVIFECAEEIIGISASLSSSCLLVNVQNRGLFALRLHGQLIWSAGPVLYQHGYRQGCRRNATECYFTSTPSIDHCEATIYISNTVGEVYALSIRRPHFKWIQDLSSYGNAFRVTAGNNGVVYVTVPDRAVVVALEASRGNVLWEKRIGPLSSADCEPVVDANGWVSYSSLDGFVYSFSEEGDLKKFPNEASSLNCVIQVNPVLDCSSCAVYISVTEMEEKTFYEFADYSTHVSALKPKSVSFTSLLPTSGSVLWSENDPSKLLLQLNQSDLQQFLVDERTLLAFFAVSRNGSPLPCRSTRQKLASSCARVKPKSTSIYTGNKKTITLLLMVESIVLILLAMLVRFCCVFWKKRKLQGLDLSKFLDKRRSLRSQKRAFDKMITELEHRASEEEVLEKLGHLVKERESIERKLSTTYSLGRDRERERSWRSTSLLPLHDGKSRSYSFQGSKKESVTIFHTLSSDDDDDESRSWDEHSSSSSSRSYVEEADDDLSEDEEDIGTAKVKGKGKALQGGGESSSDYERPLFLKHSFGEIEEVESGNFGVDSDGESRSMRRTASFTGSLIH